jgi:outer membrane biosynthesis protein TonB
VRDWRGPVALVLAFGVSIALVAGVLLPEITPGPLTTEEVGLVSTLSGAVIGAIAAYLGSTRFESHHRHEGSTMQENIESPEREGDEPVEPEPVPAPDEPVEPEPTVEPDPDAPPESPDEEMGAMSGDSEGE